MPDVRRSTAASGDRDDYQYVRSAENVWPKMSLAVNGVEIYSG
jgi:hypothetical protein